MYFSPAVATPESRTTFVGAVTNLAKTYKLDGIDFECVSFFVFPSLVQLCLCIDHAAGNTPINKALVVTKFHLPTRQISWNSLKNLDKILWVKTFI